MSVPKNIYVGKRYVPKLFANPNDGSANWINTVQFESLTVVLWQGASYTSKQDVPIGIDIGNINYWVKSADYNAQVAIYEQNVRDYHDFVTNEIININQQYEDFTNDNTSKFNDFKNNYTNDFNNYKLDVTAEFSKHDNKIVKQNASPCLDVFSFNNNTYNHFGLVFKLNNSAIAVVHRESSIHVGAKGNLILRLSYDGGKTFNYNTLVADNYDNRYIGGLVLANGRFIITYGKTTPDSNNTTIGFYVKYSDDNGISWSNEQKVYTTNLNECIYGKAIELPNKIIQPIYYTNGFIKLSYIYSTDNGITWNKANDFYSGTENLTETAMINIGNKIIAIARNENHSLKLFKSEDLGNTWNVLGDIVNSGEYPIAPDLNLFQNSNGKYFILLLYCDRTNNFMRRRYIALDDLATLAKWSSPKNIYSVPPSSASGYGSIIKYTNNVFKYLFFRELSQTATEITLTNDFIEDIPDYDSGWLPINLNTSYNVAHGLGVKPRKVICLLSQNSDGAIPFNIGDVFKTATIGVTLHWDNGNFYIGAGTEGIFQYFGGTPSITTTVNNGYYQILAWK
jgi:hypothetical protein